MSDRDRAGIDDTGEPAGEPADKPTDKPTDIAWLLNGAQFFVDWARESVIAPHADHRAPEEHPDCVLCRSVSVLSELTAVAAAPGRAAPAREVQWIPVVRRD